MDLFQTIKHLGWKARLRLIHIFKPWMGLLYSPIIVYSMGKVGSSSVQTTLNLLRLPNPIFHVHFLAWENLDDVQSYYQALGIDTVDHVTMSRYLRAFADRTWGKMRWKIITLVREPVGRDISDLFENLETFPQLRDLSGDALVNGVVAHLQNSMADFDEEKDYASNWYDRELKQVFGFDIYTAPLDPAQGYAIYKTQNADILFVRLEDLSRCGPQALQEFLGLQNVELAKSNEGTQKMYKQAYRQVLNTISFPLTALDKVYDSRYARRFYSEAEICTFKKRWAKKFEAVADQLC